MLVHFCECTFFRICKVILPYLEIDSSVDSLSNLPLLYHSCYCSYLSFYYSFNLIFYPWSLCLWSISNLSTLNLSPFLYPCTRKSELARNFIICLSRYIEPLYQLCFGESGVYFLYSKPSSRSIFSHVSCFQGFFIQYKLHLPPQNNIQIFLNLIKQPLFLIQYLSFII